MFKFTKKSILLIVIGGAILFIILFVAFGHKKTNEDSITKLPPLYATDVVANNTQQFNVLNRSASAPSNLAYFFTGSNIAELNLRDPYTNLRSTALFQEYQYGAVSKITFDPKVKKALLRIDRTYDSVDTNDLLFANPSTAPSQFWVLASAGQTPRIFTPSLQNSIIDAAIKGDTAYLLIYESDTSSKLVSMPLLNTPNAAPTLIAQNLNANSILGIPDDRTFVLRGENSVTSFVDGKKTELKASSDAFFYADTRRLIVREKNQLSLYDTRLNPVASTSLPDQANTLYQSDASTIIATDSPINARVITVGHIEGTDVRWEKYAIKNEQPVLKSTLTGIFVVQNKPLVLAVSTINDQLIVISTDIGDATKSSSYIKNIQTPGVVSYYDLAKNTLELYKTVNLAGFQSDFNSIEKNCKCDLNQVQKKWIANSNVSTDDYGGDGVPPEDQD